MNLKELLAEATRREDVNQGLLPDSENVGPTKATEDVLNGHLDAFPAALAAAKADQAGLGEAINAILSGVALAQATMKAVEPFLPLLQTALTAGKVG